MEAARELQQLPPVMVFILAGEILSKIKLRERLIYSYGEVW